jgi:small-conductance mechanosensitive channel
VTQWTRSDRQRCHDIDVAVAYGVEPERMMRRLAEAAAGVQ